MLVLMSLASCLTRPVTIPAGAAPDVRLVAHRGDHTLLAGGTVEVDEPCGSARRPAPPGRSSCACPAERTASACRVHHPRNTWCPRPGAARRRPGRPGKRVDDPAEAVQVDGHVVLDIEPVELTQRTHQRSYPRFLSLPGNRSAQRARDVERVDLVGPVAAQRPVLAHSFGKGQVASRGSEMKASRPLAVDADDHHRVGQEAGCR